MFNLLPPYHTYHASIKRYHSLLDLMERGFMTPSFLSTFIMYLVLPAKFIKHEPSKTNSDAEKISAWKQKYIDSSKTSFKSVMYWHIDDLEFKFKLSFLPGECETLHMMSKIPDSRYVIYYPGNAQDAMNPDFIYHFLQWRGGYSNYIFWNYPGTGLSKSWTNSVDDLFNAGYQQVKNLMSRGVAAENITLYGFSLGGGVATHVARRLHEENHPVNLVVERSFSIFSYVPNTIFNHLTPPAFEDVTRLRRRVLLSAIISFALTGIALGTTIAGLMSSVGLLIANVIDAVGIVADFSLYLIGLIIQVITCAIGEIFAYPVYFLSDDMSHGIRSAFKQIGSILSSPLLNVGAVIQEFFSDLASLVDGILFFMSGLVGGMIGLAGLIGGVLTGFIIGAVLMIQEFWTDNPVTISLTPAMMALAYSACFEINSVYQMQRLLQARERLDHQSSIQVINTLDDIIIKPQVSLNAGLALKLGQNDRVNEIQYKHPIESIWYQSGGHDRKMDRRIPFSHEPQFN